jgi:phosphoribosyl 1,2-cyclic phosphate phosphodiesterase
MTVTFLGTGTSTGIPLIGCNCEVCISDDLRDKRTRCSVFIEISGHRIIIDTGPDFRSQMLREGFDDLDAVLFTHHHKDHLAGLDDIRPINYLKRKSIDIYANRHTISRLYEEFPYIFDGSYAGPPLIHIVEIENENFHVGDVEIIPVHAMHGHDPVLGFRIADFTYLTDANSITKEEIGKIRGSKVFVINALRREQHYSHFSYDEAIEVIREVGAERSYMIHMSHFMGKHNDVEEGLPPGVFLSYDGLKIEL